jgi:hypothetical protein
MNNELFNLEFLLSLFGALSLGYATYKGIKWLWVRKPRISFKNPLKSYIRKEVINYLKEIQK